MVLFMRTRVQALKWKPEAVAAIIKYCTRVASASASLGSPLHGERTIEHKRRVRRVPFSLLFLSILYWLRWYRWFGFQYLRFFLLFRNREKETKIFSFFLLPGIQWCSAGRRWLLRIRIVAVCADLFKEQKWLPEECLAQKIVCQSIEFIKSSTS